MNTTDERKPPVFETLRRRWRASERTDLPLPPKSRPITVALSRQTGAGGGDIARHIGNQTGWAVYDRELVEIIAHDAGIREELIESVDERKTGFLADSLEAFIGAHEITSAAYAHRMAHTILALATHGDCVIVGRGAAALLPRENVLRVRVVAPLDIRVERVARGNNISANEASRLIKDTDRQRWKFVKGHFHRDVNDLDGYELVVNTTHLSNVDCADVIVKACESPKVPPKMLEQTKRRSHGQNL